MLKIKKKGIIICCQLIQILKSLSLTLGKYKVENEESKLTIELIYEKLLKTNQLCDDCSGERLFTTVGSIKENKKVKGGV